MSILDQLFEAVCMSRLTNPVARFEVDSALAERIEGEANANRAGDDPRHFAFRDDGTATVLGLPVSKAGRAGAWAIYRDASEQRLDHA